MGVQGRILGYSADFGSGAITGADGERYKFAASAWKGQGDPAIGTEVDFEVGPDGDASDIYPLKPASASATASAGATSGGGEHLARLKERPATVAAAVALAICLFVAFVTVTPPRGSDLAADTATLFGVSKLIDTANRTMRQATANQTGRIEAQNDLIAMYEEAATRERQDIRSSVDYYRTQRDRYVSYGYGYGPYQATPQAYQAELEEALRQTSEARLVEPRRVIAEAQSRLDRLNREKPLIPLAYLVYLTPLLAAAILVMEFRGGAPRLLNLAFGASAALSVGLIYVARSRLGGLFGDLASEPEVVADRAIDPNAIAGAATAGPDVQAALVGEALLSPALGAWLLLAVAAALIAVALNLVKAPRSAQGRA